MAIHVIGKGQDFLLATHDTFFLPNTRDYRYEDFAQALHTNVRALARFFLRNALFRAGWSLVRSSFVRAMNPLAITYFSQTAYRFGDRYIVKLQAHPRVTPELRASLADRIRYRLKQIVATARLTAGEKRRRAKKLAIEDWCERYQSATVITCRRQPTAGRI